MVMPKEADTVWEVDSMEEAKANKLTVDVEQKAKAVEEADTVEEAKANKLAADTRGGR